MCSQALSSLVAAGLLLLASPAAADVRITMSDGVVTVLATEATIREILAEWQRVGQTRIVNVERLGGGPVTLELVNVTEAQALDTILRSVSGYLAAPRATRMPNASAYDRIFLMPASTGTQARPAANPLVSSTSFVPQVFQQTDDPDDAVDARQLGDRLLGPGQVAAPLPTRAGSTAGFGEPAGPALASPTPTPDATIARPADSTMPIGVATPGMVVPVSQPQPGALGARRP
jgi:hypothetical protein